MGSGFGLFFLLHNMLGRTEAKRLQTRIAAEGRVCPVERVVGDIRRRQGQFQRFLGVRRGLGHSGWLFALQKLDEVISGIAGISQERAFVRVEQGDGRGSSLYADIGRSGAGLDIYPSPARFDDVFPHDADSTRRSDGVAGLRFLLFGRCDVAGGGRGSVRKRRSRLRLIPVSAWYSGGMGNVGHIRDEHGDKEDKGIKWNDFHGMRGIYLAAAGRNVLSFLYFFLMLMSSGKIAFCSLVPPHSKEREQNRVILLPLIATRLA